MLVSILVLTLSVIISSCADPALSGNLVAPTVDEDAAIPALDINGTRLHVRTFGNPSNDMIVFLHGGPGSDHLYLLRLTNLQDDYFLVYFDQRGAGVSRRHNRAELTLSACIQDLDQLIEHFRAQATNARRTILAGSSWGGAYIAAYLGVHPDKADKAVLINSQNFRSADLPAYTPDLTQKELNNYLWNNRFITGADHARMDYSGMIMAYNMHPDYHLNTNDPPPMRRFGAACAPSLLMNASGAWDWDYTAGLGAYTNKVLFLTGSLDARLGTAMQARQTNFFPNAVLVEVQGAGHDLGWSAASETMAAIRQYLTN